VPNQYHGDSSSLPAGDTHTNSAEPLRSRGVPADFQWPPSVDLPNGESKSTHRTIDAHAESFAGPVPAGTSSHSITEALPTIRLPSGTGTKALGPQSAHPRRGSHWVASLLATLVVLEAAPTTLWVVERFNDTVEAEARNVMIPTAPTAALVPLAFVPPCEPPATVDVTAPVAPNKAAAPTPTVAPAMAAGILAATAPFPLRIFERGKLVGTTEAETLMLPVGQHDLEFVNDAVGYRASRGVRITARERATIRFEPPPGVLNVNAVPWAEVWIDERRVGETPLGNLQVPLGTRTVVFRHPELGEAKTTVLITLGKPARVIMDMRTK
jgi:hypothetical protein